MMLRAETICLQDTMMTLSHSLDAPSRTEVHSPLKFGPGQSRAEAPGVAAGESLRVCSILPTAALQCTMGKFLGLSGQSFCEYSYCFINGFDFYGGYEANTN